MRLSDSEKAKAAFQIVFSIVVIAIIFFLSDKIAEFQAYGYAGAFLISFLSAATVLLPVPGWATVIALSKALDPYLLGVAAGLGSGLGEIFAYEIGNGAAKLIDKNDKNAKMVEKYGMAAIFFLAFVPNPLFDVAGLAAGALRMPLKKFLVAAVAGRILRFIIVAYFGAWVLAQF